MLLLAILITTGLLFYIQWSFTEGYSRFFFKKGEETKQVFLQNLLPRYKQVGDWSFIRRNKKTWGETVDAVAIIVDPHYNQEIQSSFKFNAGHIDDMRQQTPDPKILRKRLSDDLRKRNTPTPPKPTIAVRFILLDAEKRFLGGPPFWPKGLQFDEIHDQKGQRIGFMAIDISSYQRNPLNLIFFEENLSGLIIILSIIMASALLITLPLARLFLRPIAKIIEGTDELVEGNYQYQISVNSKDELEDLAKKVNVLADRLKHNEIARKRWVADISHELRTPISVLKVNIEALEDGITEPSADAFKLLQNRLKSLNTLVDDLHDLSLSEIGALGYDSSQVDVLAVLNDVCRGFSLASKEAGLGFEADLCEQLKFISIADGQRLNQVFSNILRNSIKYTQAPGFIQISAEVIGDKLYINFEDSSPSVSKADMPHIFERLYRVDSSRNRKTGGSGLGLAICQNIVAAHDGTIDAQPSKLGGLKVSIKLPMNDQIFI